MIWDTINAFAEEYIRACTLTRYDRQDLRAYKNCHDMIHTGMNAISLGTRLFLNHICESAFHMRPIVHQQNLHSAGADVQIRTNRGDFRREKLTENTRS